ncbi:hypothetical protein M9Y10_010160 [Tritrichomonas musculus]|uniref:Tetraspanin family protein n=1 Tax=Tritrichomonas musculus TaxID=1915356 RepID=A0ABR2IQJ3_9EUKA
MARIIWFLIGIISLPTHFAQLIPFLKRKSPPPFGIYFASLMVNLGIAFLIGLVETDIKNQGIDFIIYLSLGIFFYFAGILSTFINICCCCFNTFNNQDGLDQELIAGFDDNNTFQEKIAQNRSFPPNIFVTGEAYHYEYHYRTYLDAQGREVREKITEKVYTYRNQFQLRYASWQEEGNPIRLTEDTSLIHGYIYCEFRFDKEVTNLINSMRQLAYDDCRAHDLLVNVDNHFEVPDMYEKICGTTRAPGEKTPCVTKWIPTLGGVCLVYFLKLFGYSTLVTSCWSSIGIYMRMKLIKHISMKPKNKGGLRCDYMQLDLQAIKTTFHKTNKMDQSDIDTEGLKQNFNSAYKINSNVVSGYDHNGKLNISSNANGADYGEKIEPSFQKQIEISPYSINEEEP